MASTAFDSEDDLDAPRVPVSQHPAFPAVVGLWFAALLGLGSLVLPVVLLEKVAMASGIAALVPAAAPPLGFTARALIAIVAAVAGAGLGVYLARRVAHSHGAGPRTRAAKLVSASRRPLSAKEELSGEAVVNGEGFPISRRRALAISEDERPSDFLYRAPLPDVEDGLELQALAPGAADYDDDPPLELDEFAADYDDPDNTPDDEDEEPEMTERQEFRPAPLGSPVDETRSSEAVELLDFRKNRAGPRGFEPLSFSPPSLARRASSPEPEVEAVLEPEAPHHVMGEAALEAVEAAPSDVADDTPPRADWENAPLENLGLVQLVQRLGSTIERRREQAAAAAFAPAPAAAPVMVPAADFDPAPAEEAVQAMAAFFAADSDVPTEAPSTHPAREAAFIETHEPGPDAAMPRPGFLSPFDGDIDESDEDVPDFSLPARSLPEVDDDAESDDNGGYSSLLGLGNPFATPRNTFVRIEEPEPEDDAVEPAVVFPSHDDGGNRAAAGGGFGRRPFDPPAPAAPGQARAAVPISADADAALRAALATLQRMSGTA